MKYIDSAFLLLLNVFILGCSALSDFQVLGVSGGGAVVNGSTPLVVMDCHYVIPRGQEAGLVVKWYKDSNPRPVYQWILGSKPQTLGLLKGRLDLHYQPSSASSDPLRAYSSLAFVKPTFELSGDYTCRVSTYLSEAQATGSLVIYTPATEFDMKMSKPSYGKVVIACKGSGVFPEPNLTLFKTDVNTKRRSKMSSLLEKYFNPDTGLYTVGVESCILGHQLIGETEFECLLQVSGTYYKMKETLLYYPGVIRSSAEAGQRRSKTGYSGGYRSVAPSGVLNCVSLYLLLILSTLLINTTL